MEYKRQAHAVYLCEYHLVLTPKYRRRVITEGVFAFMALQLKEIRKHYPEIEFKEMNHDVDHLHLLIGIPPKMAVGAAVRIIKSNTGRAMRQKFPPHQRDVWGCRFLV